MSKRKGRVTELETQIRNLKVKQGRILKASKNNHVGLQYWKQSFYDLVDFLEENGISLDVDENNSLIIIYDTRT